MTLACLLLAAGGSKRLGSPKQLLLYQGRTLLRRAAESALAAGCRPVVAVLGAGADALRGELAGLAVRMADNPAWTLGMGASIRRGMETLAATAPEADAVLLTLCDQPLVGADQLRTLRAAFEAAPPGGIVAAGYGGTVGVPAVFGRADFEGLESLPDPAGAKRLLEQNRARVVAVPMPEAATDVDTREEYERLKKGVRVRDER